MVPRRGLLELLTSRRTTLEAWPGLKRACRRHGGMEEARNKWEGWEQMGERKVGFIERGEFQPSRA